MKPLTMICYLIFFSLLLGCERRAYLRGNVYAAPNQNGARTFIIGVNSYSSNQVKPFPRVEVSGHLLYWPDLEIMLKSDQATFKRSLYEYLRQITPEKLVFQSAHRKSLDNGFFVLGLTMPPLEKGLMILKFVTPKGRTFLVTLLYLESDPCISIFLPGDETPEEKERSTWHDDLSKTTTCTP